MTWTTWRQHRAEALAGLAALVLGVACVLYAGTRRGFAGDAVLSGALIIGLGVAPALVGVFLGAPLLSRDLERGTHRLVWTQGTTRARWLTLKLLLVFGAVVPAGAILGGLAVAAATGQHWSIPFLWFDETGPAFAGYVAFAMALGVAAGAALRRSYPAMALTLVLFVTVRVVVGAVFRPNYLPPLRVPVAALGRMTVPNGDAWTLGIQGRDAAGHQLSSGDLISAIQQHHGDTVFGHYGITAWLLYQPGDRFWLFQGIETAIFAALAALLVGFTAYWVLRRVEA